MKQLFGKKFIVLFAVLALLSLAACGNANGDDATNDDEALTVLEAKLEAPETADAGETIEVKGEVNFGDEVVKDAEVEFEFWEDGKKDDSYKIDATNHEDGTYTAETSFDHDGVFTVQIHVTARDQHTMPLANITVGEGATDGDADHDGEHGDHGDHGSHAEGFNMHFMDPDNVKAGAETELMVHVQQDNEPLKDVEVNFEIKQTDGDDNAYIDAEMTDDAGEYVAKHTFKEAGTYNIVIHVKGENDLHEHEEHEVVVE
ncbi:FixH family protein [Virgibacillus soli]|uniref:FixH family protein n=1 Tax=Paracerasibacillus soli TaxID=480284 RepID=UPI0035E7EF84